MKRIVAIENGVVVDVFNADDGYFVERAEARPDILFMESETAVYGQLYDGKKFTDAHIKIYDGAVKRFVTIEEKNYDMLCQLIAVTYAQ